MGNSTRKRHQHTIAIALVLACCGSVFAANDDDDERFLSGLRSRRLYTLAESHCRQRLAEQNVSPTKRAELVVELIRSLAEHAINERAEQREPLWAAAEQTAASFVRDSANNPRLLLVRTQQAKTTLARGELERQEAEVGKRELDTARTTIRGAIRLFNELEDELTREIPRRRRARLRASDLTADELFALQNNIRLQLARAYRNQALSYPAGDVNRLAALNEAVQILERPLQELPADDPLAWRARVDRVVCLRLSQEYRRVEQLLPPLLRENAPTAIRQQAAAELARLRLAAKQPESAWVAVDKAGEGLADLDYARLETLIALWKTAGESPIATERRQQAIAMVNHIEQQHGPYWGRRASQLLVGAAGSMSGSAGGSLEILRRTAEAMYRKGELNDSLQAYDKAAAQAVATGNSKQAFELSFMAARIKEEQGQYRDYMLRLRRLSVSLNSEPKAPTAHQLAVSTCVTLARRDHAMLKLYQEMLQEHLSLWPQAPTANQMRLWLARIDVAKKKWSAAIALYEGVSSDSEHHAAAIRGAATAWRSLLNGQESVDPQMAEQAARFFEIRLLGPQNRWPATWSDLDRLLALTAAELRLKYRSKDYARAEQLLTAALNSSPGADADWIRSARSLLVAALAGQPQRRAAATTLLESVGQASATELLAMIESLARLTTEAAADVRPELARLELKAADLLAPKSSQLKPSERRQLDLLRGKALALAGRREESLAIYQQLAKANPRDGGIQQALAEQLSLRPETLTQAVSQWRRVARGSKPRTPRWYNAKYELALALVRLGGAENKKAAAELIKYLQATSGLQATPLKPKFLLLLKRCEAT